MDSSDLPRGVKRKSDNKNVSVSLLTKEDRKVLSDLVIKFKPHSLHGNSKSPCWNHIGQLYSVAQNKMLDEMRLYCSPCLEEEKKCADNKGHISNVKSFATSTSTGTMMLHLSLKHNINQSNDEKNNKVSSYFKKCDSNNNESLSSHELNRRLVIWFCRDLLPFENVSKTGMIDFFHRVMPNIELPTPSALLGTALDDVYRSISLHVANITKDVKGLCLMFDSWTDRYKGRAYLGVRASFVKEFQHNIVTLGCNELTLHTAQDIANHVLQLLKEYIPDVRNLFLTSCHDGAANVRKTSELLKVENFQHCVAHALHLLLTVDSINQVSEVVNLLQKCRQIVSVLHFKGHIVEEELMESRDKVIIDSLRKTMANCNSIMETDEQYPVSSSESDDLDFQVGNSGSHTLKGSCPTRWNSSLTMIESILDLKREVSNALKHIGKADLCLTNEEVELLDELKCLLKPFEAFTEIVGVSNANLSCIPLIKFQIKKLCGNNFSNEQSNNSIPIQLIKKKILAKLDQRLVESKYVKILNLLDPSMKNVVNRDEAVTLLEGAVKYLSRKRLVNTNESIVSLERSSADGDAFKTNRINILKQELLRERGSDDNFTVSSVNLEITNYLSRPYDVSDEDILSFWKKNQDCYPVLSQIACIYYSMSASSVCVESMFSITGLIMNSRRSLLCPEKLNRITFVHDNYNLMNT